MRRTVTVILCDRCESEVENVTPFAIGIRPDVGTYEGGGTGTAEGWTADLCHGCAEELIDSLVAFMPESGIALLHELVH